MLFLYSAYDKIKGRMICSFASESDGLAIREQAVPMASFTPLGDIEFRCVAELSDTGLIARAYSESDPEYHVVDWDSYKLPESPLKKLKPSPVSSPVLPKFEN